MLPSWKPPFLAHLTAKLDPVTRGWLVVVVGNVGRMALSFAASVLIARALGPERFATYAILGAAMTMAGVAADLGLTTTAVKRMAEQWPAAPEETINRGRIFFWNRAVTAVLLFVILALAARPLASSVLGLEGISNGPLLVVLAMTGMVAVALSGGLNAMLQATHRFGALSLVNVVNAGLTTIFAVLLFITNRLNLVTALLILGTATTVVNILLAYYLLPGRWPLWKIPNRLDYKQETMALFRFGRWLWIGGLFAIIAQQLDLILVNRLTSSAAAGAYALALNLAFKADVVNQSLYTTLLPAASGLSGREGIGRYLRRSLARSGVIALGLLLLIPLARPFIVTFYGPDYAPAVPLFQLLIGMVLLDLFTLPVILLAFPLNQPRLLAAADGLRMVVLFGGALLLIPIFGPGGAAAAKIVAKVAGFLLILIFLNAKTQRLQKNAGKDAEENNKNVE
ncbi:MAG: oligosaccharide flippase family protein [Candidatus Promineifilaceae bacterium]